MSQLINLRPNDEEKLLGYLYYKYIYPECHQKDFLQHLQDKYKKSNNKTLQQYFKDLNQYISSVFDIQKKSDESQSDQINASERKKEMILPMTRKEKNEGLINNSKKTKPDKKKEKYIKLKASSLNSPPKGIKNIGNTCYSSCILQIMLHNYKFSSTICKYRVNKSKFKHCQESVKSKNLDRTKKLTAQFILNGSRFIITLQKLFMNLISDSNDQANPQELFDHLVDRQGKAKFEIGRQEDIFEFMDSAFQLIEEGFKLNDFQGVTQKEREIIIHNLNCFKGIYRVDLIRKNNDRLLNSRQIPFNHIIVDVKEENLLNGIKKEFTQIINDFKLNVIFIYFCKFNRKRK